MDLDLQPLNEPKGIGLLKSNKDRLNPFPPLERLRAMSHEAYEDFILEWAHGFLSKKDESGYTEVYRSGGAGDMGRDIVAIIDSSIWDNYQCKYYDHALYPGDIWLELGKLCYYTFHGNYKLPRNYYFVAPDGAGGDLQDYVHNPTSINNKLLIQWEKKCEAKITSKQIVKLEGKFKDYVASFDFSILKIASPLNVIEQHSKTIWHHHRFGLYKKNRPLALPPATSIHDSELTYVKQIFQIYEESMQKEISTVDDFVSHTKFKNHFDRQRIYYYSAESLRQFARDLSLDAAESFIDLKKEILSGVIETCEDTHDNGMKRLKATLDKAVVVSVNDNMLLADLRNDDRKGICHHLANEGQIMWTQKD